MTRLGAGRRTRTEQRGLLRSIRCLCQPQGRPPDQAGSLAVPKKGSWGAFELSQLGREEIKRLSSGPDGAYLVGHLRCSTSGHVRNEMGSRAS